MNKEESEKKDRFFAEKGRLMVSVLFFLAFIIRNRGMAVIACTAWIFYLGYCIKATSSKIVKVVDLIFIAFAVVIIGVNLYGWIQTLL